MRKGGAGRRRGGGLGLCAMAGAGCWRRSVRHARGGRRREGEEKERKGEKRAREAEVSRSRRAAVGACVRQTNAKTNVQATRRPTFITRPRARWRLAPVLRGPPGAAPPAISCQSAPLRPPYRLISPVEPKSQSPVALRIHELPTHGFPASHALRTLLAAVRSTTLRPTAQHGSSAVAALARQNNARAGVVFATAHPLRPRPWPAPHETTSGGTELGDRALAILLGAAALPTRIYSGAGLHMLQPAKRPWTTYYRRTGRCLPCCSCVPASLPLPFPPSCSRILLSNISML